jgi:hypothetical protein
LLAAAWSATCASTGCHRTVAAPSPKCFEAGIVVNQFGYRPNDLKIAVVRGAPGSVVPVVS